MTPQEIEDNFNNLTEQEKQYMFQCLTPELAVIIDKCVPGIAFIQQVAGNLSNRKK